MAHKRTARAKKRRRMRARRRLKIFRVDHLADVIKVYGDGSVDKMLGYASMSAGDRVIWVSDDEFNDHTIDFSASPDGSPFAGGPTYELPAGSWVESRPIKGSAVPGKTYQYQVNSPPKSAMMSDPGIRIDP